MTINRKSWGPNDIYTISPSPGALCGLAIQAPPIWLEIQDLRNLFKKKVFSLEGLNFYFPRYKDFDPYLVDLVQRTAGPLLKFLTQTGLYSYASVSFRDNFYELRLPNETWLNKREFSKDALYSAIQESKPRV